MLRGEQEVVQCLEGQHLESVGRGQKLQVGCPPACTSFARHHNTNTNNILMPLTSVNIEAFALIIHKFSRGSGGDN